MTREIFGTVASEYAYNTFAPCLIMPLCSWSTPGRYPVTSTKFIIGIEKLSQNLTNLAIFPEEFMSRQPANTDGWLATMPIAMLFNLANPTTAFWSYNGCP